MKNLVVDHKVTIFTLFMVLLVCEVSGFSWGEIRLERPVPGVEGTDWVITFYVDLAPRQGQLRDYLGGIKTYDGHNGVDFAVPNFRWVDNDFPVLAAAPGRVTALHDQEFDRHALRFSDLDFNSCGRWNFVEVTHSDGSRALYGHLKKNSVVVSVGQQVTPGQRLGVIASSGCSSTPHLHFELRNASGSVVDPFLEGLWINPPRYDVPLALRDYIITDSKLSEYKALKDPLPNVESTSMGSTVGVGVLMGSNDPGDKLRITLHGGDGTLEYNILKTFDRSYNSSWWYWNRTVTGNPGTWRIRIYVNDRFAATHDIFVSASPLRPPSRVSIPDANLAAAVQQKIGNTINTRTILNLTHLDTRNRWIKDLTGLEHAHNLRILKLDNNVISDVSRLARLTQLETLSLKNNDISNVSPLVKLDLPGTQWDKTGLYLNGNPLSYTSINTHIPAMQAKGVRISFDSGPFIVTATAPPMYWTDKNNGTLHRFTGDKVENLLPNVHRNATSLILDVLAQKVYWTEQTSKTTGKIQRANLDGSNVQLVKALTSRPYGITIDIANSKLYLTNTWGKIQRLNFDGSDFEPNFITNLESPKSLTLDLAGGKIYWTESGERIRRANLDGSNVETLITDLGILGGIVIAKRKIYWTEQTGASRGQIQRANLNGTNIQRLTSLSTVPLGIAVDVTGRKLYWSNAMGQIQRANLNGKNIEPVIVGLDEPAALVLDTGIVGTSVAAAPTLGLPDDSILLPNYPNPFNPETWIPYQLAVPVEVTLHIYAVNGTLVRTLALGHQTAGTYHSRNRAAYWDGRNALGEKVASGIYFYTLTAGDFTATRKLLIRK